MKPSEVRILVVDDDDLLLETISSIFKLFQFNVDTATSGNNAWAIFQKSKPYDIVLTDVRMPDGDGLELARRIKSKNNSSTSVLFISGFSDLLNEEVYHLGVDGIYAKPFDAFSVKKALETCLLAPEVKWAKPIEDRKFQLFQKKGKDFSELEKQRSVVFGRGGFFMSHLFVPPKKGTTILFEIEVSSPAQLILKGSGIVKWHQNHGVGTTPSGLGIEITSMPPELARIYREQFGNVIPFIPSPRKWDEDKSAA